MRDKTTKSNAKKPIFKKWWFWVIIVLVVLYIIGSMGTQESSENGTNDAINSSEQQPAKQETTEQESNE